MRSLLLIAVATLSLTLLPASRGNELDPVPVAEPAPAAAVSASDVLQPLQRSILATHPVFSYRFTRAESVLATPGDPRSTTIQNAKVTLHWNLGQFMALSYTPAWTFYSDDAFEDNLSHVAVISMKRGFVDWNVRASHAYRKTSLPLVETGKQTGQEAHTTSFQAQRGLGARTTLQLGLTQNLRSTESFSGYKEWSTDEWLHYQLSSSLVMSGGLTFGYVSVDDGPDMNFRQAHGRVRWRPTEKISADLRAGLETRDFADSRLKNANTPIYGAGIEYRPVETTTVSVTGDRSVTPSYFQGQVNRSSTWQASLSQRLLERYFLVLGVVRRTASHGAAADGVIVARHDSGRTFHAKLGTHFRTNGTVGVFYAHKRNQSNDSAFDFSGSQYGFEFTYRY